MAKGIGEGYGGPLTAGVAIDTLGNVKSLAIIEYRETPSFFQKVLNKGLLKKLVKLDVNESLSSNDLMDGVTGATFTSRAITEAVNDAVNKVLVFKILNK